MHHATQNASRPRGLLAAIGAGSILAAATIGLAHSTADAAPEHSTAYGAAATGTDPADPHPTVSSSGEVKTATGSHSGNAGTFRATGITVKAGAGMAESHVSELTVGGESFGAITATCRDGVSTVKHSGKKPSSPNMKVTYGSGGGPQATGITVTITGAGGETAQTVTAAVVRCGKAAAAPPTTTTTPPRGEDTSAPTSPPSQPTDDTPPEAGPDTDPDRHESGTTGRDPSAPAPQPRQGHHPVTG